ncbi:MAG TPA: hypothetical protein VFW40_05350 [Capsulimonadaceae bacterium]|nr:hypothetical protein [Capsulimonadaceae bacterium]
MQTVNSKRFFARGAATLGISAIALMAAATAPGLAQNRNSITAQQAIHDLKADYGVMIIPHNGIDMDTLVNTSMVEDRAAAPSIAVARLANAIDARSRKVFIIIPATSDRPVTTRADASAFEDNGANVTLQLSGLPAKNAINAVAAADGAAVDLRSDVGTRTVDLDGSNMSLADAISRIAAQTNTHWILAYELMPSAQTETAARPSQYHRTSAYSVIGMDQGPTGPVIFHPTPVQQPAPAQQPAPTSTDQAANDVANSSPTVDQSNATPTVPASPYASGYIPPYFIMQNGYGYQNGVPYPQTWSGFSNGGGFVPGSGLYLTPGFGFNYGMYGPPLVSGGSTITSGF